MYLQLAISAMFWLQLATIEKSQSQPTTIVASCDQKHFNCCELRPNFYLLRIAGYLNTTRIGREVRERDLKTSHEVWYLLLAPDCYCFG